MATRRRNRVGGAILRDGRLAVGWTRRGKSVIDAVRPDGRSTTLAVVPGAITGLSAKPGGLLIESQRGTTRILRAGEAAAPPLAEPRGRIAGPAMFGDSILIPVTDAGVARIWQLNSDGRLSPWGALVSNRIFGLAPSPDGQHVAALSTEARGRSIVVLDRRGRVTFRWSPGARSLNAAAWIEGGKALVAPKLDAAGWRLMRLDPSGRVPPADIGQTGFAVVRNAGDALYAVRAGETTGARELWRLDGEPRRLPFDLTLFDIVNWVPVPEGVWLPDRTDPDRATLVLRRPSDGAILRRMPAPGLGGAGIGLAADAKGPIYVGLASDMADFTELDIGRR